MQLHISPSLRHVTVLPGKGLKEFIKVKVASRRLSYRMLFYSLLFFTFLLRFVFVLTAVDGIDGENKCSTIGCLGKKLGPRILGKQSELTIPEVIYQTLDEPLGNDELKGRSDIPQSLEEFMAEMKEGEYDAKTFAVKLREMVTLMEQRTRLAKIQEYLYRHVASSSIPKQLHCLALRLAHEHTNNAAARLQLPSAELVPALVDNSYFHFVLASDNVLAASVVAKSLVRNCLRPNKVVLHIITDKKTYDLTPLWDIDMNGKVNGAVETCTGEDKFVMSKRLKSYLNFSHPLISENFSPNECAWAYGMNIFDLEAWRKTNISNAYDSWVEQVYVSSILP